MKGNRLPIGGEFWFQEKLQDYGLDNSIEDKEGILLSGGLSAIEYILNLISLKKDEVILIPSYLCPSILNLLDKLKVNYRFYEVKNNLSISINSISRALDLFNVKALFFINYFGVYHSDEFINFGKELRSNGIVLIEDSVQMFWVEREKKFIGDYVFNSYRKFLPIDGSILLGGNKEIFLETCDEYFKNMNLARKMKFKYINTDEDNELNILRTFEKAHSNYYERNKVYGMNSIYKDFLNHTPFIRLNEVRKQNYRYLYSLIKRSNKIEFLLRENLLEGETPLSLPICVNNRDYVKRKLSEKRIYAPIHWDLGKDGVLSGFNESLNLSERIISLPIDWRYDSSDMEYLAKNLLEILE